MGDCLFCKIGRKEINSMVVFENEDVMAFRDIDPKAPVHILFIPKKHIDSAACLAEADAPLLGSLFAAMASVAAQEGLEDGWRVVSNVGENGGQTVGHLHFHLLGGRKLGWPPG